MAVGQITTINELQLKISQLTTEALNNTMDRLFDKLMDFIDEDIYKSGGSEWYERTGDIKNKDAWTVDKAKAYGNQYVKNIRANISFDESQLSHNLDKFQHGSRVGGELAAQDFLDLLNGDTYFGSLFNGSFPWDGYFWDDFQDYCAENFNAIFKEEANKLGLNI